jgi:hypothetical protein
VQFRRDPAAARRASAPAEGGRGVDLTARFVIARSEATKQSRTAPRRWIASLRSQ